MALQLWHLTWRTSAFQPRVSSARPRSAAARSCSTMPPVVTSSLAGDSVPQNGQISFCLAGFQTACPPQAGHANLEIAAVSLIADNGSKAPGAPRRYARRDTISP